MANDVLNKLQSAQIWWVNNIWYSMWMKNYLNSSSEWEQSTYFKWLTKKQEDYIFDYVDKNASNQLEKNMLANEMYKTFLQWVEKDRVNKERETTKLDMTNRMVTSKDDKSKNSFSSQLILSDVADIIREDADRQWYDLSKKDDKTVVDEFMKNNPKYTQQIKSILSWKSDVSEFWNQLWVIDTWTTKANTAWWWRWLANQQSNSNIVDTVVNPIWAWFEWLDNLIQKIPTFTWEWMEQKLLDKLNNLSDKEIEQYRKNYNALSDDMKSYFGSFENYVEEKNKSYWDTLFWIDVVWWQSWPNVAKMLINTPASLLKTISATARWVANPYDTMKWLVRLVSTEEWKNALIERYGSLENFAKTLESDPVWVASDALTLVQWWSNVASKVVRYWSKWARMAWLESTASKLSTAANDIKSFANTAWEVADMWVWVAKWKWLDLLKVWAKSENTAVRWASKVLDWSARNQTDFMKTNKNRLDKATENALDKLVWLWDKEKKLIKENPEVVNYVSQVKNRINESWVYEWGKEYTEEFYNQISDEVKGKIRAFEENRLEDSKLYDKFRESFESVDTSMAKKWVDDVLDKHHITRWEDWLDFKDAWMIWWSNAIKEIYDYIERHPTLDWDWMITLKEMFRDAKSWKSWTKEYGILKDMENAVNEDFRWQSKSYKELDAQYEKDITLLNELKDWLTNKNWTVKANLNNILKKVKSNPELWTRLEEFYPWINKKIEALNSLPKMLDSAFGNSESAWKAILAATAFWMFWSKTFTEIVKNIALWAWIKAWYNKAVNTRWEKALSSLSDEWKAYLQELSEVQAKWWEFTTKQRESVKRLNRIIQEGNKKWLKEELQKWSDNYVAKNKKKAE